MGLCTWEGSGGAGPGNGCRAQRLARASAGAARGRRGPLEAWHCRALGAAPWTRGGGEGRTAARPWLGCMRESAPGSRTRGEAGKRPRSPKSGRPGQWVYLRASPGGGAGMYVRSRADPLHAERSGSATSRKAPASPIRVRLRARPVSRAILPSPDFGAVVPIPPPLNLTRAPPSTHPRRRASPRGIFGGGGAPPAECAVETLRRLGGGSACGPSARASTSARRRRGGCASHWRGSCSRSPCLSGSAPPHRPSARWRRLERERRAQAGEGARRGPRCTEAERERESGRETRRARRPLGSAAIDERGIALTRVLPTLDRQLLLGTLQSGGGAAEIALLCARL